MQDGLQLGVKFVGSEITCVKLMVYAFMGGVKYRTLNRQVDHVPGTEFHFFSRRAKIIMN